MYAQKDNMDANSVIISLVRKFTDLGIKMPRQYCRGKSPTQQDEAESEEERGMSGVNDDRRNWRGQDFLALPVLGVAVAAMLASA
jgi:hypothetical protein